MRKSCPPATKQVFEGLSETEFISVLIVNLFTSFKLEEKKMENSLTNNFLMDIEIGEVEV